MTTQVATQRLEINGAQLEVRERGSGEPVIFIHGGMTDECAAVVKEPALVSSYRVIDYHRRGWGHSNCPDVPVTFDQQSADVRAIMAQLGVERAHFAGLSYGGTIILHHVRSAPETVHSLALMEPGLPSVLFNSPQFGTSFGKAASLYAAGDKAGAIEAFAREVAGPDYEAATAAMDKTLEPGYFERWVAAADTMFVKEGGALAEWSFTSEDAARIKQPVLNMTGASAQPYFREIYETVRAWFPQAENVELPDASHAMLQMNPKGAAEVLAGFFSRHPLRG